jgi:hypothetical protein
MSALLIDQSTSPLHFPPLGSGYRVLVFSTLDMTCIRHHTWSLAPPLGEELLAHVRLDVYPSEVVVTARPVCYSPQALAKCSLEADRIAEELKPVYLPSVGRPVQWLVRRHSYLSQPNSGSAVHMVPIVRMQPPARWQVMGAGPREGHLTYVEHNSADPEAEVPLHQGGSL